MNHPIDMLPEDIRSSLLDLLRIAEIPSWFQRPNPAFGCVSPLQLIKRGESSHIRKMIYELESGQPG